MLVSNKAENGLQPQDVNQDFLCCMDVNLSLSHSGKKTDGGYVRAGFWGDYLDLSEECEELKKSVQR